MENRGAARSDKPRGPYTMERLADDTIGVLDAAGIGRAHLLGESMGGMIAQHAALRYPDRLRSLILLCTLPGGPQSILADYEVLRDILDPSAPGGPVDPQRALEEGLRRSFGEAFIAANREMLMRSAGQEEEWLRTPPEARREQVWAVRAWATASSLRANRRSCDWSASSSTGSPASPSSSRTRRVASAFRPPHAGS